jgi:hypothetical protein
VLFGIVVFFGAFVDMVHMAVRERVLRHALGIIEDGGEMFAMSLVCWFVISLLQTPGRPPALLARLTRATPR